MANDEVLTDTLSVGPAGAFAFRSDTIAADPGYYALVIEPVTALTDTARTA